MMTDSSEITKNFIDVERVFAQKSPGLYKILPGFIFSYLQRITHQEEINGHIYNHRDKFGLDFIDAILREFGVETEIKVSSDQTFPHQLTNSPVHQLADLLSPTGRYIFVSNHPLGGIDGMALMKEIGKARKDIVFPVNDLLMNLPGLKPLFIPINKHGRNTENAAIIEQTFASEKTVLYFPAGLVSRKQKGGVIADLEWKKTFISRAKKHHRDVVPVFITGKNSDFFYNLSLWRRRLGIKANIEMLYLADEMIKQKGNTLTMIFGEPITYTTFDKTKTDLEWAKYVREIVYSLGK